MEVFRRSVISGIEIRIMNIVDHEAWLCPFILTSERHFVTMDEELGRCYYYTRWLKQIHANDQNRSSIVILARERLKT